MSTFRRTVCVVAAAGLLAVGGAAALGSARTPVEPSEMRRLLKDAGDAYERGDVDAARALLRSAQSSASPEGFHRHLADAGDAFDAKSNRRARSALKSATWLVEPYFWFVLGFVAQILFSARFIVQWVASERKGESYFPMSFWYFSLFGSCLLLVYAVWREDPVFILGQSFNSVVYVRNLMLIFRQQARERAAAGQGASQ